MTSIIYFIVINKKNQFDKLRRLTLFFYKTVFWNGIIVSYFFVRRLKPFCLLNKNTKRCTRELSRSDAHLSQWAEYYIYNSLRRFTKRKTRQQANQTLRLSVASRYSPFIVMEIRRKRFCDNQSRQNLRFFSLALALSLCFVFNVRIFSAFKICAVLFELFNQS